MAFDGAVHAALEQAHALQAAGRLNEAEAAYRALARRLDGEPLVADNLGVVLARQGRLTEAIACFRRALDRDATYAPARHNLVQALLATDDVTAAADTCEAWVRQNPRDVAALTAAGKIGQRLGRWRDALDAYELAVLQDPDHLPALIGRGTALLELRRPIEAAEAFESAWERYPGRPEPRHGLAQAFALQGRPGDAIAHWRRLIDEHPDFLPGWVNLVEACWISGRVEEARLVLAEAAQRRPQAAALHGALGDSCGAHGALDDAVACYRRALGGRDDRTWRGRLVGVLARQGKHLDAVALIEAQLIVEPDDAAAHVAAGRAYAMIGDAERALPHLEAAIRLGCPDGVRLNAALLLPAMPTSLADLLAWRQRQLTELYRLADSRLSVPDPLRDVRLTNFYLAYHGLDDRPHQEALSRLYRQASPSLLWTAPHCRAGAPPRTPGRLRIGFLSSFLCNHTIGRLNAGFIEHLDRERFEVTMIHGGDRDAMTEHLAALADRDLRPGADLETVRRQVAELELDVLIYTDIGMEAMPYFLAFARLAPVQIANYGHPDTTGIPTVDYFLSDATMEPDDPQRFYSERLVNLGLPPCYYDEPVLPPDAAGDRERLGLASGERLYVCPQSLFKLHPEFDAYLSGIVERDPDARLVFIAGTEDAYLKQRFCERLTAGGLDLRRLLFLDRLGRDDFLRLLRTADVLIDPLHFVAGNTAYEAIAVGTPLVTQPGAFMRGRLAYAYYRAIGVTDGVVWDRTAYVDTAVAIAADPDRRRALQQRILANKGRLFGNLQVVRRLEAFLEDAVAGRAQSQPGWAFPPATTGA